MKPLLRVHPLNTTVAGRQYVNVYHVLRISEWDDGSVMVDTDDQKGWLSTKEWLDDCLETSAAG